MRARDREMVAVVASVRLHDSWGKRLIFLRHDLLILYLLFPLALCLCFRSVRAKKATTTNTSIRIRMGKIYQEK